jgi:hypothetical protein
MSRSWACTVWYVRSRARRLRWLTSASSNAAASAPSAGFLRQGHQLIVHTAFSIWEAYLRLGYRIECPTLEGCTILYEVERNGNPPVGLLTLILFLLTLAVCLCTLAFHRVTRVYSPSCKRPHSRHQNHDYQWNTCLEQ